MAGAFSRGRFRGRPGFSGQPSAPDRGLSAGSAAVTVAGTEGALVRRRGGGRYLAAGAVPTSSRPRSAALAAGSAARRPARPVTQVSAAAATTKTVATGSR